MRLITAKTIEEFGEAHADSREVMAQWCAMVSAARWCDADHVRQSSAFPVRPIGSKRLVFNLKGNHYRVICDVRYADPERELHGIVYVQWVGTHAEYNDIVPETIVFKPAKP